MKLRRSMAVMSVMFFTCPLTPRAYPQTPAEALPQVQQPRGSEIHSGHVVATGRVNEVHGGRLYVLVMDDSSQLPVLVSRALPATVNGATVQVRGVLRSFDELELTASDVWNALDEPTRQRFAGHRVLVASTVRTTRLVQLPVRTGSLRRRGAPPQPETELEGEAPRITIRPTTIANAVDDLAGQRVRILNARVVGMFGSRAFLIESATTYEAAMGFRDRILVLIDNGRLRVPDELLVGSTVVILGVARTLLGLRVSPELPWPSQLDPDRIERLEVRAGVLATSVQTPEGTELTEPAR